MILRLVLTLSLILAALSAPSAAQQVEPGVTLASNVTLVEHLSADAPEVLAVHASKVDSNAHTGSNFARSFTYTGQHQTVEIDGLTSTLILKTNTPVFYVRIDPEDPDDERAMWSILRLKRSKETRVVINFTENAFGGGRKRHVDEVAVTKTDAGTNILKITAQDPLPPGEYGLVPLPTDTKVFTDRVYTFTVPDTAK